MILRQKILQSFEEVLIHELFVKSCDTGDDVLSVFRFQSSSQKGHTVRCQVAKQQSGWDFQDQCSVISLELVLERFVMDVEVMCFICGCKSHVQTSVSSLMGGEWGSIWMIVRPNVDWVEVFRKCH